MAAAAEAVRTSTQRRRLAQYVANVCMALYIQYSHKHVRVCLCRGVFTKSNLPVQGIVHSMKSPVATTDDTEVCCTGEGAYPLTGL